MAGWSSGSGIRANFIVVLRSVHAEGVHDYSSVLSKKLKKCAATADDTRVRVLSFSHGGEVATGFTEPRGQLYPLAATYSRVSMTAVSRPSRFIPIVLSGLSTKYHLPSR